MTKISELHRRWSKDAAYKDAYDALGEEFDLARALIEARTAAGLSQSQLARRMKTSQSYIARVEGGKVRPSTDALERFRKGHPDATPDRVRTGARSVGATKVRRRRARRRARRESSARTKYRPTSPEFGTSSADCSQCVNAPAA
jgi:hypothetical protein